MNIGGRKVVPVEIGNIPSVLPEYILSNTNCTNESQFTGCATGSADIIKIIPILH